MSGVSPTRRRSCHPLGLRDEYVTVGDHIAYFWETSGEFREAVGFLEVGFDRGEFCVIFGHTEGNRRVCESLAARGYDCAYLEGQGRLIIVPGQTNAAPMLSAIGQVFTEALERGATLIRLLGNIGWGYHGWPDEKDLLEFEARVTGAAKQFPCVVVCMYDVGALSGRVILHGAFETHPLTFFRNIVRGNNQYVKVDEFLAGLRADDAPLVRWKTLVRRLSVQQLCDSLTGRVQCVISWRGSSACRSA